MRGRGFFIVGLIIASLARVASDEPVDLAADPQGHNIQAQMLSRNDGPPVDRSENDYLDVGSRSNAKKK